MSMLGPKFGSKCRTTVSSGSQSLICPQAEPNKPMWLFPCLLWVTNPLVQLVKLTVKRHLKADEKSAKADINGVS